MSKHHLTLENPKKSSHIPSDICVFIFLLLLSSLSFLNTQLKTTLPNSSVKEDKKPVLKTINYLIEYHFRYENDSLLQSAETVDL